MTAWLQYLLDGLMNFVRCQFSGRVVLGVVELVLALALRHKLSKFLQLGILLLGLHALALSLKKI